MTHRRNRSAILTMTLLAAAGATPAWAVDCEALRQQLVGQYGVFIRYSDAAYLTSQRCQQLNAQLVLDQAALAQCNANLQIFLDGKAQAQVTYQQAYGNYSAVCTTTATYGPTGAPAYAQDTVQTKGAPYPYNPYGIPGSPYEGQPSATIQTPNVATPSDFGAASDEAAAINNFIGVLGGVGLGGRGRGRSFKSGDC